MNDVNFSRLQNVKLSRMEGASASGFHLGQKHYVQITWKAVKSVGAGGNRWENRHGFKVLVCYEESYV